MKTKLDFVFRTGSTYRLYDWGRLSAMGTVYICRELKAPDHFGNRILLCNFRTNKGDIPSALGFVEICKPPKAEMGKGHGTAGEMLMLHSPVARAAGFTARAFAFDLHGMGVA